MAATNDYLQYVIDSLDMLSGGIGSEEDAVVDDVLVAHTELSEADNGDIFAALDAALADGTLMRPAEGSSKITVGATYDSYILPLLNVAADEFEDIDALLNALTLGDTADDVKSTVADIRRSVDAGYLEANSKLQVRLSDSSYLAKYNKARPKPVEPRQRRTLTSAAGAKASTAAGGKAAAAEGEKKPSLYNLYVKSEGPQVRLDFPGISPQEAMSEIAARWKDAPENPKNQPGGGAKSKAAAAKKK